MCQVCHEMKMARDCMWSCSCKHCAKDLDRCTNWVYDPPNQTLAVTAENDSAIAGIIEKLGLVSEHQHQHQVEEMDIQ